eukprot:1173256-Pleurochrysis_carterae.AAC.1
MAESKSSSVLHGRLGRFPSTQCRSTAALSASARRQHCSRIRVRSPRFARDRADLGSISGEPRSRTRPKLRASEWLQRRGRPHAAPRCLRRDMTSASKDGIHPLPTRQFILITRLLAS